MEKLTFLNQTIENILQNSQAEVVTEIFLFLLLVSFSIALWMTYKDRVPRFVSYAPTLLTSLGILGTFVGIVVGLMNFKPDNIDASIPALLEGLKTAFITSLVGMGSAIFFKILTTTSLIAPPQKKDDVIGAGPEEILGALLEQNQILNGLKTAVSGTEETSLVGQLKLLRSDENDRHKEVMRTITEDQEILNGFADQLWQKLNEFAEMLSKSATEQMMNALRDVVVDFNKNLTEQFGDNFKALDASVQKLVEWQDNYRQQLKQMSAQYEQAVRAITQIEASVVHIAEESQEIPITMKKLEEVLVMNQHQLQELSRHLEAFRAMRDKAVEAVPQIREQIDQTVSAVAASVQIASKHYTKLLDLSDAYIEAHDEKTHEQLDAFIKTTNQGIDRVREGLESGTTAVKNALMQGAQKLDDGVQDLQSHLTKTADRLVAQNETLHKQMESALGAMNRAIEGLLEEIRKTVSTTGEGVNKQLSAIDQAMQQEINRVMNEMGHALAQISGQFTGDYKKLVQAMQQVVAEQGRPVR